MITTTKPTFHFRRRCLLVLLVALRYARELRDHSLIAGITALTHLLTKSRVDSAREKSAIQSAGLDHVIALTDKWESDLHDERTTNDIIREAYRLGVEAGIDSIMPEWADLWVRVNCNDAPSS